MPMCSCGLPVEPERLAVLPYTDRCAACALANPEPKVLGVPAYGHKTGGGVAIIHPSAGAEAMRLVSNQYRRVRYRG